MSDRLRYYINEDGVHVNVQDLVAALRRLETFRYYGGGTEPLRERTGQTVAVLRELGDTERDEEAGRMFRVRFPDGHEADAFEEELEPVIEDSRARVGVHSVADAMEALDTRALAEYGRSAAGFQGGFLAEVRRILGG